jgi:phosphohistidine swiveling domain-containing protein
MRVETKYEKESSSEGHVLWWEYADPPEFVVNIEEKCEMELVGGKAFNISKMVQEGLPVPPGFCVTTKAYTCFMDFNNISEDDECISDRIREALMPPLLSEVLCEAYRTYLQSKPCAVRSSSPVEDLKNASFAGQYESFLNVQNEDDLLEAVKKCWASLWSRSVAEYRKKMEIGNENIKMAVLVQEMVPATASGVMFTEDPMVIEGVWGLGDLLVGGKAIPDRYVISRDGFTVLEEKIAPKHYMSQGDLYGVKEVPVPESMKDAPILNAEYIHELCELGIRIENLFGCPQDIEWALYNHEFVLLQARPISEKQEPTVWSRANIAETQPGYVTYLSRVPENRPDFFVLGVIPLLECFGINDLPKDIKFLEYIYGYMYANINNLHNIMGRIPGLSPEVIDKAIGHTDEEVSVPKVDFSDILKILPGTLRVIRFFLNLSEQAEKVIPHSIKLIEEIRHKNIEEMTIEELEDLVWEMYDRNQEVFQVHASTMLANMSLFGFLQKILARVGEEGAENLLVTGLEGMSSCQLGSEMWKLAQSASKSIKVSEMILSRKKDDLEKLKESSEGLEFLKDLQRFMERFGDRGSQEMELSVPRWEENPQFVLSMVANYLSAKPVNPAKTMEEQKNVRFKATDRILKKLSRNFLEKLIFKKILKKTQQYLVMRENLKTTWVRGISAIRVLYLPIADMLVDHRILENRDDIFYLKMTEVSDVITGNLKKRQVENLITERKEEKEVCEHLDVPMLIVGKPPPIEELTCTVEPQAQLEGLGCSQGMVRGRARVVLDPNECTEFKEGEILVAPVTDPGWSPLFVTAGGLVMELGGTLSHGVIIAREYGIPAVVGVKNVTKIIKTGQVITVDGNKGLVYIRE